MNKNDRYNLYRYGIWYKYKLYYIPSAYLVEKTVCITMENNMLSAERDDCEKYSNIRSYRNVSRIIGRVAVTDYCSGS